MHENIYYEVHRSLKKKKNFEYPFHVIKVYKLSLGSIDTISGLSCSNSIIEL